jgi:hypothetical protein
MRYWLWRAWKWAVLVVVGVSLAVVPSVAQGSATIIILPSSIVPYPTPVFIQISGTWRDSCKPKPPFSVSVNTISNTITISSSDTSLICASVITSWGPHTFSVGVLPPGTYLVQVFHTANDGTHLLGMRTFVVVALQPPQPPTPPTPTAVVCDPGAYAEGLFLRDGARYLATGGTNPSPDKRGVDHWADLSVIDSSFLAKWQAWGKSEKPFEAGMNDDGDWVVYRIAARNQPLAELQFCLKAVGNKPAQVEVFVQTNPTDPTKLPAPDGDIRGLEGWTQVGTLTVGLGSYQIYTVSVSGINASAFYNVALRLVEEAPDGNVIIAWLKLRA